MNKDLTIFSVYHKEFDIPDSEFIQPIQVGKLFSGIDMRMPSDDEGEDHIANKNETFSELTAMYWIWKNLDRIETKFIGLCHYRRYFTMTQTRIKHKLLYKKVSLDPRDVYLTPFNENELIYVGTQDLKKALLDQLTKNRIIVPKPAHLYLEPGYPANVKMHYIYYHIREDWYLMRSVVTKGDQIKEQEFDAFFENTNTMCCYNMFVTDKHTFAEYCTWLFPLLFELEETVKLSPYPYQRRIFGFFSERLFNYFIFLFKKETAEFPIVSFT
ncbi:DUF4422 domain-containing protein [Pedobacter sp. AW1-32]|uniref:DUF4422 domain-containing protein n=1 Tax=Pedobacter sp. AW1-32 TaxID=3383026 RepID=UPI003FED8BF9